MPDSPAFWGAVTAVVVADGHPRGTGVAPSKKRAEQIAARIAVRELGGA